MELARFKLGYLCSCILEGCRPKEALPECFAGKRSCANVVTTNASMYLCQQLLSIFLGVHFNFTPLSLLLYSALSTNWYILDCRATFSASSGSSGSSPDWRKRTICCAHAGACGSTTRTKGISAAAGTSASTARTCGSAGA